MIYRIIIICLLSLNACFSQNSIDLQLVVLKDNMLVRELFYFKLVDSKDSSDYLDMLYTPGRAFPIKKDLARSNYFFNKDSIYIDCEFPEFTADDKNIFRKMPFLIPKRISELRYVIINYITKSDNIDNVFKTMRKFNKRLIGKSIILCEIEFYGPHGIIANSYYIISSIN